MMLFAPRSISDRWPPLGERSPYTRAGGASEPAPFPLAMMAIASLGGAFLLLTSKSPAARYFGEP